VLPLFAAVIDVGDVAAAANVVTVLDDPVPLSKTSGLIE